MDKLVSDWCTDQSLPESYIFPPETRPGKLSIPSGDSIPVVDLGEASINRSNTIQKVLKASQDFGFFQVVNHGVSQKVLNGTMSVVKEFFEMPTEDKTSLYSEDPKKVCRLYTSNANYGCEKFHFWRDVLKHPCHPLEECIKLWPDKPTSYREVIATFSVEAKKLGLRILELLSEGLGLESGHFEKDLSEALLLVANHYPPCPDPSLTLGLPKHCDPNLITILLQGDACGLQVFKDGEWIGIEPLPNAFVVNIGHQLRIVSNNKLKSAEHRVVTNSEMARTTVGLFISSCDDSIIEPAKSLTNAGDPPLYRAFQYKDFISNYVSMMGDTELALQPFKLQFH
ncbi:2-oxoglutarate and Fe(II)-dependent oxygenase superfamily protein, putative [Theobroma cacao]|uniref:2-oxoglutarate and Fe(II)-dependent oxygenase superfamily protein, putative n=1 Tax=Theobroma cacao TaxID=3641 RepID=A0A061DPX6_THECC|nr:2-oxoglutarate and Fe(II)-dependent oxygenase superfamily protein, putative [Theobroma cacao]